MAEIRSFSDYTSKYNSNIDFASLFGGTPEASSIGGSNVLSSLVSGKVDEEDS